MPAPLTLFDIPPGELMADVYFQPDFLAVHAGGDAIDWVATPDFRHAAAVRPIGATGRVDLETPWGYGGPIATSPAALESGLAAWTQRQTESGRVAEFIRLHPFLNPLAFRPHLDTLRFNRLTVVVPLDEPAGQRWKRYSDSTRACIRKAERSLTLRPLSAADWPVFKAMYEAGLERSAAAAAYYLDDEALRRLLAQPWCRAWVAEDAEGPVAASCFLHAGSPLCHYHLAGGNERSRRSSALYLLLEHAMRSFADLGCRWMLLGGGRSPAADDALLAFKAKFSPVRCPFYVGGRRYDPDAIAALGGNAEAILPYRLPGTARPAVPADRLTLRRAEPEDYAAFHRLKCDVENLRLGSDRPPDWQGFAVWYARARTERDIFLVEAEGTAVGYTYAIAEAKAVELSVGIDTRWTGLGYASRAIALTAEYAAAAYPGRTIRAWVSPRNDASVRAHRRAGFTPDPAAGHHRATLPETGEDVVHDCWVFRKGSSA